MEQANWLILFISAFIPLLVGFIWYRPAVFGNRLAQMTGETSSLFGGEMKIGKLLLIYIFGLLFSYILSINSVHQFSIHLLFFMEPSLSDASSEYSAFIADFMDKYGHRHRSFWHGMIHGSEASLFYGLTFLGITALLNGKPLRTIWIHLGFCIVCGALMAGLNCTFF